MLTDQTFQPAPIIGVGPELFYDPIGVKQIDMEVISVFRRQILPFAFFKFAYFAIENSRYGPQFNYCNDIEEFGIVFAFRSILQLAAAQGLSSIKKAARLTDAVYSPEFSAKILLPVATLTGLSKVTFLETLIAFQEEAIPYTPRNFRELTTRKWTAVTQKSALSRRY